MTGPIQYQLVRARRKTIAIHVKPQGVVEVRAPLKLSSVEVARFVTSKEAWIKKHLQRFEAVPAFAEPQLCWGGNVQVFGTAWPIVKQGFGDGSKYQIELKLPWDATPEQFQAALDQWFRKLSLAWLQERLLYWRQHMHSLSLGIPATTVGVRKMKRRWGSCRRNGSLLFNTQLLKYPPQCIDCVVVHELCHLLHFNHSPAFYRLMTHVMPDWKGADDLLRDSALHY